MNWYKESNIPENPFPQEPLDPELQSYVQQDGRWTVLKHPLVFSVPYFENLNGMYNKQLRAKREAIQEAEAEGNYRRAMWFYERPYRLNYFQMIAHKLQDEQYWEQLGHIYTDSENLWQNKDLIKKLLRDPKRKTNRHMIMDEDDRKIFSTLPESFKIYRGCTPKNRNGMSWTLDPAKAEWFATRYLKQEPIVLTGIASKKDVIAYFGGRSEQEIVIDPAKVMNKEERAL